MIIVLDKTENIDMIYEYLANIIGPGKEFIKDYEQLFWQTDLDHEDLKYKIDVYVR